MSIISNEFLPFLLLFSRSIGFFLFSPFFHKHNISLWIRIGLALSSSLILFPPFFVQSRLIPDHPLLLAMQIMREAMIGYLIGFLCSLIFQAAAFAGQIIGTLGGFSAYEILNPLSHNEYPLMSYFFMTTVFTIFFSLDFHHVVLRLLYESHFVFSFHLITGFTEAFGKLFIQGLSYALFPMIFLLILISSFAILARFFPFLHIFWNGFPIQIFVGLTIIAVTGGFFSQILQGAFNEIIAIAKKALFSL
ncbi:MAG: flagellar biosynthetic protein FliR [Chlamydiales bacterium]